MDQTPQRRAAPSSRSGFTLMEVLIAMLILALAFMAILSMQFASYDAMAGARDNTNTAELADRVAQVMRLESQQWRDHGISEINTGLYDTAATPWAVSPMLPAIEANGWTNWTQLLDTPVDARVSTVGAGRYCAYARGGLLQNAALVDPNDTGLMSVQIAIVYPGVNQQFADGACPTDGDIINALEPTTTEQLELQGFRANYFGTMVRRRGTI